MYALIWARDFYFIFLISISMWKSLVCVCGNNHFFFFHNYIYFLQLNDYEDADRKNLDCAIRIRRSLISQGMKPNFLQILLVWSPTGAVTPDTIVTFLSKFENNIQIREQWNQVTDDIDSTSALGCIMATFLSFEKMYTASKALSVSFE